VEKAREVANDVRVWFHGVRVEVRFGPLKFSDSRRRLSTLPCGPDHADAPNDQQHRPVSEDVAS
jgi:hypothetical protein